MTWIKLGLALLNLLDFLAGQLERWQIRQSAKAEVERDTLKEIVNAVQTDNMLEDRVRSDPALYRLLRRRYERK